MSPRTVILSAPQGWGKTRNAETLRQEQGCSRVVDSWNPNSDPVTPGALHLTNMHPADWQLAATLALGLKGTIELVVHGWEGGAA